MSNSDFAKRQLKKHGWTEGSGLGKQEHGRSEPIKVSLKMDKTGVGHDPGKEFTDHWWLRVFNEAAQKIGKKQQDPSTNEEDTLKSKQSAESKNNLYKNFVKSSTLTNGVEETNSHSDSSSDDSEHDTSVPTLNDIHKFCGGATGHKAARFGIKMGGKLARIAQHDKMFEERLEKAKLTVDAATPDSCKNNSLLDDVEGESSLQTTESLSNNQNVSEAVDGKRKKKKHKKDKCSQNGDGGGLQESLTDDLNDVAEAVSSKEKRKKKKERADTCRVEDTKSELSKGKRKGRHASVDSEVHANNVAAMESEKTEEEIPGDELHNESRSEKKRRSGKTISSNGLLDKTENKAEGESICSEFPNKSGGKKKKNIEDQVSSEAVLDESRTKKKNEKAERKISRKALRAESETKAKAEEHTSNEFLDEPTRKRKKKRHEQDVSGDELVDKPLKISSKKVKDTVGHVEFTEESDSSRQKKNKV